MHLAYAARLIVRRLPLVLLAGLLGLGGGLLASRALQHYTTTAYLSVTPSAANQGIRAVDPQRFFHTKTQLVVSDEVLAAAAKDLGGTMPASQLRQVITLGGGATDDVLRVAVTGDTPQRSQERATAVLHGIQTATPKDEIVTQLLWTTAPQAAVSRGQLAAGGLLGGLLLGALAVMVAGAVRRPVLDPRFVQLSHSDVAVHPRRVPVEAVTASGAGGLAGWLRAHNPAGLPVSVVPVGASAALADPSPVGTGATADAGPGRFLVYVAPAARTTEGMVEDTISSTRGPADQCVLVVTDAKTSHHAVPEVRRARVMPVRIEKD